MVTGDSSEARSSDRIVWERPRRSYKPHRLSNVGRFNGLTITVQGSPERMRAAADRCLHDPQWPHASDIRGGIWNALRLQDGRKVRSQNRQELAAKVHRFITLQQQLAPDQQNPRLQRAQAAAAAEWAASPPNSPDTPRWRRIHLCQFLMRRADPEVAHVDLTSFERRYIRPGRQSRNRQESDLARERCEQQLIAEGYDPDVRALLASWEAQEIRRNHEKMSLVVASGDRYSARDDDTKAHDS
jgi:hypothetical protein